ncbi:MAG TPA: hypothetical protein VKR22_04690 [Acidimicrobiales bacterium]|nr:hypothetical protein [Acidimicrobiales bacterium]
MTDEALSSVAQNQPWEPGEPTPRAQSANLVRIVSVFYALVLGQALISRYNALLHPDHNSYWVAGLVLIFVFVGAAWEYFRLSNNVERFPYDVTWFSGRQNHTGWQEIRFGLDLLTAAGYAVLLIESFPLKDSPHQSISSVFATMLVINALSYLSFRAATHKWDIHKRGSFARWTTDLLWWPLVFWGVYWGLDDSSAAFRSHRAGWNEILLLASVIVLFVWELLERKAIKGRIEAAPSASPAVIEVASALTALEENLSRLRQALLEPREV